MTFCLKNNSSMTGSGSNMGPEAAPVVRVNGNVLRDGLELRCSSARGHHLIAKRALLAGSVVVEASSAATNIFLAAHLLEQVQSFGAKRRKHRLLVDLQRTLCRSSAAAAWQSFPPELWLHL